MNLSITNLRGKLKKTSLLLLCLGAWQAEAQETITVFDGVLYYDGYAGFVEGADLLEPISSDILRFSNAVYAKKLTDAQLDLIGNTLDIDVKLEAACDNYDRLGHVTLAFTPKGVETYVQSEVQHIEVSRFITPFMNKNNSPNNVNYHFKSDNVADILSNTALREQYDIWVEFEVFGTTGAGQTQVSGCSGHKDTFRATLKLTTSEDSSIVNADPLFFKPILSRVNMNNYDATDVPGETTKLINFHLDTQVENLKLFLITSNHGSNSGGEEYIRRRHNVYLNNTLIYAYAPGGKSCEPYRQFNTQGNGIYGVNPMPVRGWIYWNNWCPGDRIPIHEVNLGTLPAGDYTVKVDVPDAVFNGSQGNFPISAYLENRASGDVPACVMPVNLSATATNYGIDVNWDELGSSDEWEVLYGKVIVNGQGQITNASLLDENYHSVSGETEGSLSENLLTSTQYQIFVRSNCDEENNSNWSLPTYRTTKATILTLAENTINPFMYYPNPVENNLYIKSDNREINGISVYDMNGRLVMTKEITGLEGMVNMESLTTGMYLLKVNVEGEVQTYKFQKK